MNMDNRTIKTNDVIRFLYQAEINWVIVNLSNGKAVCWEDGNVKVFTNINDLMLEFDQTSQSIMTEYAYIQMALDDYPE